MKRSDLFPRHEPPPGGLARLREAIAEPRRSPAGLLWLVPTSALAAALIVATIWAWPRAPRASPASAEPVQLAEADRTEAALVRVPTANPNVVFYWVGRIDDRP